MHLPFVTTLVTSVYSHTSSSAMDKGTPSTSVTSESLYKTKRQYGQTVREQK
jgi:hypothetical protein